MSAISSGEARASPQVQSAVRRVSVVWPWLLVCAGWSVALLGALTHQRSLLDHSYLLRASHLPWLAAVGIFAAGWLAMTAAMMLPASMPIVAVLATVTRVPLRRHLMLIAFLGGYALTWTGFAVVMITGDTLVHTIVAHWPWLAAHPWLIGATTLAVAGCSELTHAAGRRRTMTHSEVVAHFVERDGPTISCGWHAGFFHGATSVGRCWALMLLVFGVGLGGLNWMVGLTVVMVAQVWIPVSRRPLSLALGTLLVLMAGLWLVHPIWLHIGTSV